jgi:putative spermidine/putrescine transport system substrate-binding protein
MPIGTSRRTFLKAGALAAASTLAAPAFLRKAWAQEPFTVRVPGGYGDIWDIAFFKPFEAATGIKATGVVSKDFPFNEFKISVETGAYRWSMAAGVTKELYFRLRTPI